MSHIVHENVMQRLQRSELAVPGSSPKMFEKALKSEADYIFLDLEDALGFEVLFKVLEGRFELLDFFKPK